MSIVYIYRGLVALWFAGLATFAFSPDNKTETDATNVHDSAGYMVVVPVSSAPQTTVAPEPPSTTTQPVAPNNNKSKNGYKSVEWNGDVARIPADTTKRCPKYEAKFAEYGLPVEIFSYISWRESRCNPKAENWTLNANGTSDHGLVQINSSWKTVTAESCGSTRGDLTVLLNVDCNLKVAKRLLDTSSNPLGNWRL